MILGSEEFHGSVHAKICISKETDVSDLQNKPALSHSDRLDFWHNLCRICAVESDYLIPIYEGEGLEQELASKISEYFPFTVLLYFT